jgi:Fe-S-cluster containining protein
VATVQKARVHLEIFGQARELEVPYVEGPATFDDLLTTARALSSAVTRIVVDDAAADGRTPSCRRGCTACCHHLIPVSAVEARALARLVAALPKERRKRVEKRFAAAVDRLAREGIAFGTGDERFLLRASKDGAAGWLEASAKWFGLRVPCPFLEDSACSIHGRAPLVCHEYLATSPAERCESLDGGAEILGRPLHGGEPLSAAAAMITGLPEQMIPLPLALEWVAAHGAALDGPFDGETLVEALLAGIEQEQA